MINMKHIIRYRKYKRNKNNNHYLMIHIIIKINYYYYDGRNQTLEH